MFNKHIPVHFPINHSYINFFEMFYAHQGIFFFKFDRSGGFT